MIKCFISCYQKKQLVVHTIYFVLRKYGLGRNKSLIKEIEKQYFVSFIVQRSHYLLLKLLY